LVCPPKPCARLKGFVHAQPITLQQSGSSFKIRNGDGVMECLSNITVVLKPLTGADMVLGYLFGWMALSQPLSQQIRK
jgi:hypothetical protein